MAQSSCIRIDPVCVSGLINSQDIGAKKIFQGMKRERRRIEHETARRVLNEYYNTEYFDTITTKYSLAPFEVSGDPDIRKAQLAEKCRIKEIRPDGIRFPPERYGQKDRQKPWEPGVQVGDRKRLTVYVGRQTDLCPLRTIEHKMKWVDDTEPDGDPSEMNEMNCRFYHCRLPWKRAAPPYSWL